MSCAVHFGWGVLFCAAVAAIAVAIALNWLHELIFGEVDDGPVH